MCIMIQWNIPASCALEAFYMKNYPDQSSHMHIRYDRFVIRPYNGSQDCFFRKIVVFYA